VDHDSARHEDARRATAAIGLPERPVDAVLCGMRVGSSIDRNAGS
jgi:hypothetical protein